MKTIVTITGIRPDFIRMSEIFKKLDEDPDINHILIHTGQHYDEMLSGTFFNELNIREPDHILNTSGPGVSHYEQQAVLASKIIPLLDGLLYEPDLILFLGDSNSVLASIPLAKEGYKIGHIEAGMRSHDKRMLEEINRKACDHVSDLLFVYHENYAYNLIQEGVSRDKIHIVGNTIVEVLNKVKPSLILNKDDEAGFAVEGLPFWPRKQVLLDIHRPENFLYPSRMSKIIDWTQKLKNNLKIDTIKMLSFGRTIKALHDYKQNTNDITQIPLLGYKDYLIEVKKSLFIISDSGTAQEEPALLNIPVLVPRDFTERPESYQNKNSYHMDLNNPSDVINCAHWIESYLNGKITPDTSWLGNGTTSHKIINILKEKL